MNRVQGRQAVLVDKRARRFDNNLGRVLSDKLRL